MSGNLPRDVECPLCGARVGWHCSTRSNTGLWRARTHTARWRAVGIKKPTQDDLTADYEDGKRRDLEATRVALERVSALYDTRNPNNLHRQRGW
jgi:hypothetical protein